MDRPSREIRGLDDHHGSSEEKNDQDLTLCTKPPMDQNMYAQSQAQSGHDEHVATAEEAELINFKTLSWWKGGVVLIAETVSLGILSLPSVLATVGLIPGVLLILFMSALATMSGLILADFRRRYPFVRNFGDALEIVGETTGLGVVFREIFGWAQTLLQIFLLGGHLLLWTVCMNTLTNSAACTVVWGIVGMVLFWLLNQPRTLKYTSLMSMCSCISITAAMLMTVVEVGVEKPIGTQSIDLFRPVKFTSAFLSVTNLGAAFSSHSIFFSVIAEFKQPEDWPKALALLQVTTTTLYIVAAVVIYVYVGPSVPSPALSAANNIVVRKAIWGVAIPTIAIAGVIYAHVAASYVFTRVFGNTKHLERRTKVSIVAWITITLLVWVIGFIIAESIPVFNSLLSLVCAAFASWFSYGLPGVFWLWMYRGEWFKSPKNIGGTMIAVVLFVTGLLLCVLGLWASIEAIADETGTKPWTCASNATP